MKILAQTLMTATALSLVLASGAMADSNKAYIDQTGEKNSALIDQDEATNSQAGSDGLHTRVFQHGKNNDLTITQTGDAQKAGIRSSGIDQKQGRNLLTIDQSGSDNEVVNASQFGSGSAAETVNGLSITQTDSGNEVSIAVQEYKPNTVFTGANTVSITQGGAVIGNTVSRLEQKGARNTATVTQAGTGNTIGTLYQGNFDQGGNSEEALSRTFQSHNGTATLSQSGDTNAITLARQEGTTNTMTLDQTTGFNSIDLADQNGTGNTMSVSQLGSSNKLVSIEQFGENNTATLTFNGASNGDGAFTLDSKAGSLGLTQSTSLQDNTDEGTGAAGNTVTFTVFGDSNLFAFKQDGAGNSISGTVGAAASNSAGNQVAVLQVGSSNVSSFSQSGVGTNDLGITQ